MAILSGSLLQAFLRGRYRTFRITVRPRCSSSSLPNIAYLRYMSCCRKRWPERIVADPGTPQYGALSVSLWYVLPGTFAVLIRPECFYPRPDVVSLFIELSARDDRRLDGDGLNLFHLLVKSAFWGRRKTLAKALADSPHIDLDRAMVLGILREMGIDEKIGENMSVAEYTILTARLQEAIRAAN